MRQKMKMAVVALSAGMTLGVCAGPIEFWEFNEAAGVDLNDAALVNSGSLGSVWNFGGAGMVTDGSGNFVLAGDGGTTTRKLPKKGTANAQAAVDAYLNPLTGTDTYSVEMNFSSWNMDTASVGDSVAFKVNSAAGGLVATVIFEVDTATTTRLRMAASLDGKYRNFAFNLDELAGHTAKIDFNLASGGVEYFLDGSSTHTFTGLNFDGDIGSILMVKNGAWGTAASSVSIDSMGLSVIPEPATLGMVVAIGGGLLFIRRRFMI